MDVVCRTCEHTKWLLEQQKSEFCVCFLMYCIAHRSRAHRAVELSQNHHLHELQIQFHDLQLSITSGNASSVHTIRIYGICLQVNEIVIRPMHIKIANFIPRIHEYIFILSKTVCKVEFMPVGGKFRKKYLYQHNCMPKRKFPQKPRDTSNFNRQHYSLSGKTPPQLKCILIKIERNSFDLEGNCIRSIGTNLQTNKIGNSSESESAKKQLNDWRKIESSDGEANMQKSSFHAIFLSTVISSVMKEGGNNRSS